MERRSRRRRLDRIEAGGIVSLAALIATILIASRQGSHGALNPDTKSVESKLRTGAVGLGGLALTGISKKPSGLEISPWGSHTGRDKLVFMSFNQNDGFVVKLVLKDDRNTQYEPASISYFEVKESDNRTGAERDIAISPRVFGNGGVIWHAHDLGMGNHEFINQGGIRSSGNVEQAESLVGHAKTLLLTALSATAISPDS